MEKRVDEFREFVEMIARMRTKQEADETESFYEDDDAIETLDDLIGSARDLTGIDGPAQEPITDEVQP